MIRAVVRLLNIALTNRMDPEDMTSAFGFGHGKSKPQAKLEEDQY